jgi:hypothetical protein
MRAGALDRKVADHLAKRREISTLAEPKQVTVRLERARSNVAVLHLVAALAPTAQLTACSPTTVYGSPALTGGRQSQDRASSTSSIGSHWPAPCISTPLASASAR